VGGGVILASGISGPREQVFFVVLDCPLGELAVCTLLLEQLELAKGIACRGGGCGKHGLDAKGVRNV
jgi:hypothetical protein